MSPTPGDADPRRQVPRTDTLLADERLAAAGARLGRGLVKDAVQAVQQRIRTGEVAPPDAVENHSFRTDASITAFDLFDISTIAFDTSAPQSPYFVPILGRLPVIGQAFQWPRGNKKTYHTSTVLVNATILPRSADLIGRAYRNTVPE